MRLHLLIVMIFLLISCEIGDRQIILGDRIVRGRISPDSSYNGLIKFFDKRTGHLQSEAFYVNNELNGKFTEYYPDGQVRAVANYVDNRIHGFVFFYSPEGNLTQKEFRYFGIEYGPVLSFEDGNIVKYRFFSFEGLPLLEFEYDLKNKKVIRISEDAFFFLYPLELDDFSNDNSNLQYLIYLPDPPYCILDYDLVVVDSSFTVYKEQPLKSESYFTYVIPESLPIVESLTTFYAIRMNYYDSLSNLKSVMFKRLPN